MAVTQIKLGDIVPAGTTEAAFVDASVAPEPVPDPPSGP